MTSVVQNAWQTVHKGGTIVGKSLARIVWQGCKYCVGFLSIFHLFNLVKQIMHCYPNGYSAWSIEAYVMLTKYMKHCFFWKHAWTKVWNNKPIKLDIA